MKSFRIRVPCPTCITPKTFPEFNTLIETLYSCIHLQFGIFSSNNNYEIIHHLQLLVSPKRTRYTTLGEAMLTRFKWTARFSCGGVALLGDLSRKKRSRQRGTNAEKRSCRAQIRQSSTIVCDSRSHQPVHHVSRTCRFGASRANL